VFQEFLAATHLGSLDFAEQIELVRVHAQDPRWSDIILCLLHQLHRPNEIDRLIAVIEEIGGDPATTMSRDLLLAEATFGEFKRSPQLALRLSEATFRQIETGRWPSISRALGLKAIQGLASPVLGSKIQHKLSEWFPRWHSHSLVQVFNVIANWPEDQDLQHILWRGLHDEFYSAARVAAQSFAKRYSGQSEPRERLCGLISAPPSLSAAAAGIEALWRGWPQLPELHNILDAARHSNSPLIAIAAIRGRISQRKHDSDDFAFLTQLGERDDFRLNELIADALLAGWAGEEQLRKYALEEPSGGHRRAMRRFRPDLGLAINGFPGDSQIAALIAEDFRQEHPRSLFQREEFAALAIHFKENSVVVSALETWVMKHRPDDAFTIANAAKVAPTPKFKAALLNCLQNDHSLTFWAASALVELWGQDDQEVCAALVKFADLPVKTRQNVAHVLPHVMADKDHCRKLLLEIVAGGENIRADFALQGLRLLGVDAADREATNCVIARGYDQERFALENEVHEVILTFKADARVVELAKRELRKDFGVIATVAHVYSDKAEMRQLVLEVVAPLNVNLRSTILDQLSERAGYDPNSRSLISAARFEEDDNITVGASIALARVYKQTSSITQEYLSEIQRELDAIGPRLDQRRQGALSALVILGRLDLFAPADSYRLRRTQLYDHHRETTKFLASQWASVAQGFGGDEEALKALRMNRRDFFDVFGNYLDASAAIRNFALRMIDDEAKNGASAPAISLVERAHPASGYLRELCLKSLKFKGSSNWESFATAMTAAEILSRNFPADESVEAELLQNLVVNPRDPGTIAAICDGWATSNVFQTMQAKISDAPPLPLPVQFKLISAASPPERLVGALVRAATQLQGDLWEGMPYWIPSIVRRLEEDPAAYSQTLALLLDRPSPGVKASFPKILSRARGFSEELHNWCLTELRRADTDQVAEVGFDLIAGQHRIVAHSLFDLVAARDIAL
jgi:hypothetical protein